MAETSHILLKVIWMVHFVLSSWAIMGGYLGGVPAYLFTQMGTLAFGFWAIVSKQSVEATLMFMITLFFSIVNDIILISIYQPRADYNFERPGNVYGIKSEYRFALGMSITNLIIKPVSLFLVYCIHKSRVDGSDFQVSVPGITISTGNSSIRAGHGEYSNIESAQDSHPGIYGRPPYQYQPTPPPSYNSKEDFGQNQQVQPPQA